MPQGARLRQLLARDGATLAPGAGDGLSACMIENAGFIEGLSSREQLRAIGQASAAA